MPSRKPRDLVRLAVTLSALGMASGCGRGPGPDRSPTSDQDPRRFEDALRITGEMRAASREAEEKNAETNRAKPPPR